ncbi:hypothetical protein [Streptomyces sp. NPDC085540]
MTTAIAFAEGKQPRLQSATRAALRRLDKFHHALVSLPVDLYAATR